MLRELARPQVGRADGLVFESRHSVDRLTAGAPTLHPRAPHIVGCDLPHDGRTLRIAQVAAGGRRSGPVGARDTHRWESAARARSAGARRAIHHVP